jgi:hypothetical protein
MPVTSLVATVVGVLLMVGRTGWRLVFRRPGRAVAPPPQAGLRGPHVSLRRRPEAADASEAAPAAGRHEPQ